MRALPRRIGAWMEFPKHPRRRRRPRSPLPCCWIPKVTHSGAGKASSPPRIWRLKLKVNWALCLNFANHASACTAITAHQKNVMIGTRRSGDAIYTFGKADFAGLGVTGPDATRKLGGAGHQI